MPSHYIMEYGDIIQKLIEKNPPELFVHKKVILKELCMVFSFSLVVSNVFKWLLLNLSNKNTYLKK